MLLEVLFIAFIFPSPFFGYFVFRTKQFVSVNGTLLCNYKPASNITVELYDLDIFSSDDLLKSGKTNEKGYFFLSGYEDEWMKINPELVIYNTCKAKNLPSKNTTIRIRIPYDYVTYGLTPRRTFNIGYLELSYYSVDPYRKPKP